MPRINRVAVGDTIYHVLNRSNGRVTIFNSDDEYRHFESLLSEAKELVDMRILAYCIMPNHWHLVLYPKKDGDMSEFMRWLTTTHVRQRRSKTETIGHGHLYQGTYKSFPVETEGYLQQLMIYVEQNPLRAKIVKRAEDWRWSSLWRREKGSDKEKQMLSQLPIVLPQNYLQVVNTLIKAEVLEPIRLSVNKGAPFGSDTWTKKMVGKYDMGSTLRSPGRPRKIEH